MKLVDFTARNKKESELIVKKVKAMVKKMDSLWGRDFHVSNTNRLYTISVDNDGKISDYIEDIIRKSKFARVEESNEYPGHYDWRSDTYSRPTTVVSFMMT